ncbi:hypothetical protein GCM10023063_17600 [Arthrobacter methylotrophus]|uniref:Uncharacterized protein n=1 Tax=Arthrobacter methylotrophus TaxID=121291 RepID=A0ABV5UNS6_9MICC
MDRNNSWTGPGCNTGTCTFDKPGARPLQSGGHRTSRTNSDPDPHADIHSRSQTIADRHNSTACGHTISYCVFPASAVPESVCPFSFTHNSTACGHTIGDSVFPASTVPESVGTGPLSCNHSSSAYGHTISYCFFATNSAGHR